MKTQKIKKINMFLISKQYRVFFISLFIIFSLIISYILFIFSSVSLVYSLEKGKKDLAHLNASNSILESNFSIEKEKFLEDGSTNLVASLNVEYLDYSRNKLVFNQ